MTSPNIDDIFAKYGRKLSQQVEDDETNVENFSQEYQQFKSDMMPQLSRYEKLAKSLGNIITMKPSESDRAKIQKQLDSSHLEITPSQVLTLATISFFSVLMLGILISVVIFLLTDFFPVLLVFLVVIASIFLAYYFYTQPARLANIYRLKASSQMVPCILYIVAYMKHTSNLERAIAFSAKHLQPPLALDLRKVFWDLETGKFSSIKDSLDNYLETWRETNIEFIESFHLVESSLYEPSEDRRIAVLERALQVILDGVYEKMLSYSREVRSPLTNLYMLGIVLPTLGIAMLPLASALLSGLLQWYQVFVIFNIIIPFFVFYMTSEILLKRPGGYGETELLELNPDYKKFASSKPYLIGFLIALPFLLIGLSPFIFHIAGVDPTFGQIGFPILQDMKIFDFKCDISPPQIPPCPAGVSTVGPYGLLAFIASLFFPLGLAILFFTAYRLKTKELIKSREASKNLENEFTNSLFQLGNRLGDGMPAEIAFQHLASSTKGQVTEGFFRTVNINIQQLGMSVEQAIFNQNRGAIIYYPSALISTSMKILVESVKRGLQIAARSLMSISEYIKNIHKINERMRDLLAEVVSDMKSNMTFLAPLLAGIVIGLAMMIAIILNKLEVYFLASGNAEIPLVGNISSILDLFSITKTIPPYFLQLAIGIYIIEIIFILSKTLVTVDAGEDKLRAINETGKNLKRGVVLYFIVGMIAALALSLLASVALSGMNIG